MASQDQETRRTTKEDDEHTALLKTLCRAMQTLHMASGKKGMIHSYISSESSSYAALSPENLAHLKTLITSMSTLYAEVDQGLSHDTDVNTADGARTYWVKFEFNNAYQALRTGPDASELLSKLSTENNTNITAVRSRNNTGLIAFGTLKSACEFLVRPLRIGEELHGPGT
jgi:hypothetical protein